MGPATSKKGPFQTRADEEFLLPGAPLSEVQFQAGMTRLESQALIKAQRFRPPLVGRELHQVTVVLTRLADRLLDERDTDALATLL